MNWTWDRDHVRAEVVGGSNFYRSLDITWQSNTLSDIFTYAPGVDDGGGAAESSSDVYFVEFHDYSIVDDHLGRKNGWNYFKGTILNEKNSPKCKLEECVIL